MIITVPFQKYGRYGELREYYQAYSLTPEEAIKLSHQIDKQLVEYYGKRYGNSIPRYTPTSNRPLDSN